MYHLVYKLSFGFSEITRNPAQDNYSAPCTGNGRVIRTTTMQSIIDANNFLMQLIKLTTSPLLVRKRARKKVISLNHLVQNVDYHRPQVPVYNSQFGVPRRDFLEPFP